MLLRKKVFIGLLIILGCMPLNLSFAETANWGTPYDKFFETDKYLPEYKTGANGEEYRSVETPGSVYIYQERKNGKISTDATDKSGLGAVLCHRAIYIELQAALDACKDLDYPSVSGKLDFARSRMNDFIMENSLEPVSRDLVEKKYKEWLKHSSQDYTGAATSFDGMCKKIFDKNRWETVTSIANYIEKKSFQKFKEEVEKILSVPRLPIMDPCV